MNHVNIAEFKQMFPILEKDIQNVLGRIGEKYGLTTMLIHDGNAVTTQEYFDAIMYQYDDLNKRTPCLQYVMRNRVDYIPIRSSKYVYFLIDEDTIIYVGKTVNMLSRMSTHITDRKFTSVYFFEDEEYDIMEAACIRRFLPKYNTQIFRDKTFFGFLVERALKQF